MLRFRNESKLRAIAKLAMAVGSDGFQKVKAKLQKDPTSYLTQFSYLGNITACHLAKSLGFQFSKPDRHLQRIAQDSGYGGRVDELCEEISRQSGDNVAVVDLVLWRAAVLTQP